MPEEVIHLRFPKSDTRRSNAFVRWLLAIILCALFFSDMAQARNIFLPYRPSGPIPGTKLQYENLHVSEKGRVTLTVYNPETVGVNFQANFSFHDDKGGYLTGFSIDGFAQQRTRAAYALDLPAHAKMKRATNMKVLGRAGRTVAN
jgi:hypothetical protein